MPAARYVDDSRPCKNIDEQGLDRQTRFVGCEEHRVIINHRILAQAVSAIRARKMGDRLRSNQADR